MIVRDAVWDASKVSLGEADLRRVRGEGETRHFSGDRTKNCMTKNENSILIVCPLLRMGVRGGFARLLNR